MYDQLKAIFSLIVQAYPYGKGQPNSFSVLEDLSLFSTSNHGKIYADYVNGDFWARDWVNGGARRDSLKVEYPLLVLEMKTIKYPNGLKKAGCYEVFLACVDNHGCPECKYTETELSKIMESTLRNIVLELMEFKEYDVEQDGETWKGWYTEKQLQQLGIINYWECGNTLADLCELPTEFSEWGEGLDNKIGWATKLDICGCDLERIEFNYDKTKNKKIGTTKCKNC